ncbi:MAG: hypothetical protein ACR2NB_12585, partial [Solirubrobacteraceae bacterium]
MAPARRFAVLTLLAALAAGGFAVTARGQGEGTLRGRIDAGKRQEGALAGAAARLGALERATARDVAVLEGRVSDVQAQLVAAQARAAATAIRLTAARKRAVRLRVRLAEVQGRLAKLLRERYVNGEPQIVTVVLNARGFADLLETMAFVQRIQRADAHLLDAVRAARADAARERRVLTTLSARRRHTAEAIARQRGALTG